MRKISCGLLTILCVACTSVQDKATTNDSRATPESLAMGYYLVKEKNGEYYIHQYDKIFVVEKTIIMDDGVIVTPTGKVFMADGRRFQMKQGKIMYLQGNMAGEMEDLPKK